MECYCKRFSGLLIKDQNFVELIMYYTTQGVTGMGQWRIQDFADEGHQPLSLFDKVFAKNCMKLREIWTEIGGASLAPPPLDPPMLVFHLCAPFRRGMVEYRVSENVTPEMIRSTLPHRTVNFISFFFLCYRYFRGWRPM